MLAPKLDQAQPLAHPELRHHLARGPGGTLQIVGGSAGHVAEHQLLRDAPAEQYADAVQQVRPRRQKAVLLGQLKRVAQRGVSARDDGDLVHGVAVRKHLGDNSVSHLVVGDDLLFLIADQRGGVAVGTARQGENRHGGARGGH